MLLLEEELMLLLEEELMLLLKIANVVIETNDHKHTNRQCTVAIRRIWRIAKSNPDCRKKLN